MYVPQGSSTVVAAALVSEQSGLCEQLNVHGCALTGNIRHMSVSSTQRVLLESLGAASLIVSPEVTALTLIPVPASARVTVNTVPFEVSAYRTRGTPIQIRLDAIFIILYAALCKRRLPSTHLITPLIKLSTVSLRMVGISRRGTPKLSRRAKSNPVGRCGGSLKGAGMRASGMSVSSSA